MAKSMSSAMIVVCVAVPALVACGKLSKSDAAALVKANEFDIDDNAYCEVKPSVDDKYGSGISRGFTVSGHACRNDLYVVGMIQFGKCIETGSSGCDEYAAELRANVSFDNDGAGHRIRFVCGKRTFVDVTSIVTEGRKATVKFNRTATLDDALLKRLSNCELEKPEPGLAERKMEFQRDDDGKWIASSKEKKPTLTPFVAVAPTGIPSGATR